MADTIQLRAGNRAGMPDLADREPAYVRDEEALYVGTPEGNVKVAVAGTEDRVETLELKVETHGKRLDKHGKEKLSATPMAAAAPLAGDTDLAGVVAAYNSLIAALKAAGMMNT